MWGLAIGWDIDHRSYPSGNSNVSRLPAPSPIDRILVLADEPTGNLDYHHANAAIALVREICGENNAALLTVSHDAGVLSQFEEEKDFAEVNRA